MATLRVYVPKEEQADGLVEYRGDVSGLIDEESHVLYILSDSMILAEFPPERYTSWDIEPDATTEHEG